MDRAANRPPISLRPHRRDSSPEKLLAELEESNHPGRALTDHPAGVVVCESLGDPRGFAGFAEGRCSVQGSFAARVASLLEPSGERGGC